ncbi:MAG: hypothetical protein IJ794_20085, partial [Lachnospiraceae bacterium]|nr:hypothetical protein [Lachnospiraceae bacterium]
MPPAASLVFSCEGFTRNQRGIRRYACVPHATVAAQQDFSLITQEKQMPPAASLVFFLRRLYSKS